MYQRELQYQREMVQACVAQGGYAKKLSHRTLVGIPDLLVKLPVFPAALVEVKRVKAPKKAETVQLDLTPPQRRQLLAAEKAGMPALVLAFVEYGPAKIGVGCWPIGEFPEDNRVRLTDFMMRPNRNRGALALSMLLTHLEPQGR